MTFATWQEEWAFSTTAERWAMLADGACPPWVYVHCQLLGRTVTGLDLDQVHQPGFEDVCRRAAALAQAGIVMHAVRDAVELEVKEYERAVTLGTAAARQAEVARKARDVSERLMELWR